MNEACELLNLNIYEIKKEKLGEICAVRDGTHDSPKKQLVGKYLVTSKNVKNGKVDFNNAYYISEKDYLDINKRSKVDAYDLLFTMIGTVGEVAQITEEVNFAIKNVGLIKTKDKILSRYLFYYLKSEKIRNYLSENISKGSQVFISLGKLRNMEIILPNKEVQEYVVSILDKFDRLINDIKEGLPKEIELRQKQYEYYRERLLNFPK